MKKLFKSAAFTLLVLGSFSLPIVLKNTSNKYNDDVALNNYQSKKTINFLSSAYFWFDTLYEIEGKKGIEYVSISNTTKYPIGHGGQEKFYHNSNAYSIIALVEETSLIKNVSSVSPIGAYSFYKNDEAIDYNNQTYTVYEFVFNTMPDELGDYDKDDFKLVSYNSQDYNGTKQFTQLSAVSGLENWTKVFAPNNEYSISKHLAEDIKITKGFDDTITKTSGWEYDRVTDHSKQTVYMAVGNTAQYNNPWSGSALEGKIHAVFEAPISSSTEFQVKSNGNLFKPTTLESKYFAFEILTYKNHGSKAYINFIISDIYEYLEYDKQNDSWGIEENWDGGPNSNYGDITSNTLMGTILNDGVNSYSLNELKPVGSTTTSTVVLNAEQPISVDLVTSSFSYSYGPGGFTLDDYGRYGAIDENVSKEFGYTGQQVKKIDKFPIAPYNKSALFYQTIFLTIFAGVSVIIVGWIIYTKRKTKIKKH